MVVVTNRTSMDVRKMKRSNFEKSIFVFLESCLTKKFDGSRATLVATINLTSNENFCLSFKYLFTGQTHGEFHWIPFRLNLFFSACLDFYAKTFSEAKNLSDRFHNFCIPKSENELFWYSINVPLPKNLSLVNVEMKIRFFISDF